MHLQPIFADSFILFKNIDLDHNEIKLYLQDQKFRLEKKENQSLMSDSIKLLDQTNVGYNVKKVFDKYISKAIDAWGYDVGHRIVNSWATKTYPNNNSHLHRHLNFWLTTVYYPKSENKFKIKFESDRFDLTDYDIHIKNKNTFNSRTFVQEVESGDLLIFSARLKHQIEYNDTNEIRYSLATNILPKGCVGSRDSELVL